jgi:hypothetical protein
VEAFGSTPETDPVAFVLPELEDDPDVHDPQWTRV